MVFGFFGKSKCKNCNGRTHWEVITSEGVWYDGHSEETARSKMRAIKKFRDVSNAILLKDGHQVDGFQR